MPGYFQDPKDIKQKISKIVASSYKEAFNNTTVLVLLAMVKTESSFDTMAFRFEPNFYKMYASNKPLGESASYGLLQVMGCTARELGFKGDLTQLFTPEIGLQYGVAYFMSRLKKYGKLMDAIAAYNAGSVRLDSLGKYKNQVYVDKVMQNKKELDVLV
jgi:soluble lytic murein transglycosylase-like protein